MNITEFGTKLGFPAESFEFLRDAETLVLKERPLLEDCKTRFFEQGELPWDRLTPLAEKTGLHPFTVHLLFLVFLADEGRKRYLATGYSEEFFWEAMKDVRYKMEETKTVYDLWGVYCGWWHIEFFQFKKFCLGRLHFEIIPCEFDCTIADHSIKAHDPVINVHIPSFGPLYYEEVLDAYDRAAEFFGHLFPDGVFWYHCETWFLYPPVKELLPEGNLKRFAEDFKVVHTCFDHSYDDRYRIFQVPGSVPMEQYPEKTSLQRNLKSWLLAGNEMGLGFGLFVRKNGTILHD